MKTMICNAEPKRPHGISKPLRWGRVLLAMSLISAASVHDAGAQTTIFSENFGTPTGTTTFANYATGTAPATFQNKGTLTFSGTGDVRTSGASTTYLNYSGSGNVFLTSPGSKDFQISGINTTGFSRFTLSFGVSRSNINQTLSELSLQYSSDGVTYSSITVPAQTAASGWIRLTLADLSLPAVANLRLKWTNTSTVASGGQQIRLDDISLIGAALSDTTPPSVASFSPANGGTEVSIGANLVASFSEVVNAGSGNVVIRKVSDETVFATIPVSDPQVSIAGNVATINPTADFAKGVAYYVNIDAGAFKDAAGNSFAGISNTTTWAFTVDSTAPVVSTFSPANGATGIAPPSAVSLTFSESINLVSGKYITIKKSDGTVIETHEASAFEGVMASGSVVTVTLTSPSLLDYGVTYYVEVEAGAVEDNSGNSFAGISGSSTFSFTTASVPELGTGVGYSQTFSSFTSIETIPLGWSLSGAVKTYMGDWGTGFNAGVVGNASVFGYQHTSSTGTLSQILTLRNTSGAPITDLVVSYKGRVARADQTRIPIYTVNVAGTAVSALGYSTADGDNASRSATLAGLNIAAGATFQVQWISDRGLSSSSSRQIGISDVSVAVGVKQFAPTVTDSLSLANLTHSAAVFNGAIGSDGGSTITERGFVYALTATSTTPTIGASGVTKVVDAAAGAEPFTASISDLTAATSYTMRAYAINGVGTSYGTAISFTTLATPPTFTSSYSQAFAAYNGTNPAGWSAISSAGSQSYAGAWGNLGGSAGFIGGDSNPGVLGYQHTSGTGTLTTTLTLINGSGGTLNQLYISYLGRAARTADSTAARSPEFAVSVNGVVVSALAYSTANNVDATLATTLTGLNIAPGAAFTISWASDRGTGSGASKQIGLSSVVVSSSAPAGYDVWKSANAGGQAANLDYDGDGISNGIEYFMGTSGSVANASPGVVAGTVTWPRASDTTISSFKVEVSTDLKVWQDASTNYSSQLQITGSQVAFTMPSSPAKLFVRLSVTP